MQCAVAASTVFITDSTTGKYNTPQGMDTLARAAKNNKN